MSKKIGEKKFSTSLFGFNKIDVNLYLESLIKSYNESLWEKESQISSLKKEIEEYKKKLNEYQAEEKERYLDKTNIADAFIEARKKADQIVEEARKNATLEKHKLEVECESLRELINERKETLRRLTDSAANFGNDLEEIMNHRIRMFKEDLKRIVEDTQEKYIFEHIKDAERDYGNNDADYDSYERYERLSSEYDDYDTKYESFASRQDNDDISVNYFESNDDYQTHGEDNEQNEGNS